MINLLKKFSNKKLLETTEAAAQQLEEQKPKVNALGSWLENRLEQNGFGEDFEVSLIPRGNKWS
jgi:hypothetical protein